jgi:site-specific recombinase XerD
MSLIGARPFRDQDEIAQLLAAMQGEFRLRNRALAVAGCRTGLRISELLSWTIGDVLNGRTLRDTVYTRRRAVKGKSAGRRLPLHRAARRAIGRWLIDLQRRGISLEASRPLFCGREAQYWRAMSRKTAHRVIADAAEAAELPAGVSTHSWRKWLAVKVYQRSGHCLIKTGAILGHRQVETTFRYCRSLAIGAEDLLLEL